MRAPQSPRRGRSVPASIVKVCAILFAVAWMAGCSKQNAYVPPPPPESAGSAAAANSGGSAAAKPAAGTRTTIEGNRRRVERQTPLGTQVWYEDIQQ